MRYIGGQRVLFVESNEWFVVGIPTNVHNFPCEVGQRWEFVAATSALSRGNSSRCFRFRFRFRRGVVVTVGI